MHTRSRQKKMNPLVAALAQNECIVVQLGFSILRTALNLALLGYGRGVATLLAILTQLCRNAVMHARLLQMWCL